MQDSGKPVKGHAQKVRYDVATQLVTLTGNAYLEQLDSNVKGGSHHLSGATAAKCRRLATKANAQGQRFWYRRSCKTKTGKKKSN